MFSIVVLFILVAMAMVAIFIILGKLRAFQKVGQFTFNLTDIFKEKPTQKTEEEKENN